MSLTKIIGVGSPLGDDRVGWIIADLLQAHQKKNIEIISCDRPQLNLVSMLEGVDKVVIIDAVKSNQEIGTIHCVNDFKQLDDKMLLSSHAFGVKQAIQLAEALNLLPKDFVFYGVEIGDNIQGEGLSPPVYQGAKELIRRIAAMGLFNKER